ncbi:L-xylulose reductase [Halotydeus destructor]|nr:L-xylulose reductase [Halotydeus destructor]
MMYDFSDKVVIVTGSSSGIGEDAVISFAKYGAQVVVTGRNADRVAAVAEKCVQASPANLKPLQILADVAKDQDAQRIIGDTVKAFGHLDILVNNAGIFREALIKADDVIEKLDELYQTNVRSVVKLTSLAAPYLISSKGNIVNVSSVASTQPELDLLPYCASKAALDMVTKCCALELGPKGVRVNSVNPAIIETPLLQRVADDIPEAERQVFMKTIALSYPLRRIGTVQDTTAGILFLASEQASFFSGVHLPIDGGCLTMSPMAFAGVLKEKQAKVH